MKLSVKNLLIYFKIKPVKIRDRLINGMMKCYILKNIKGTNKSIPDI